ncbi:MAG: biopolymer transporter ExbD [Steroidobacteraceae bacterium]
MSRRSYTTRKLVRRHRKPSELMLVPMIDIFTVLVTFLLMTAIFSRTVIIELKLPTQSTDFVEPPPGLILEILLRKEMVQVADRNTGPLATFAKATPEADYNYLGVSEYLQRVKNRYPEMTDATLLLEPDIAYDTLVQVMDSVRSVEVRQGPTLTHAELFPNISIGDAPEVDPAAAAAMVGAQRAGAGP